MAGRKIPKLQHRMEGDVFIDRPVPVAHKSSGSVAAAEARDRSAIVELKRDAGGSPNNAASLIPAEEGVGQLRKGLEDLRRVALPISVTPDMRRALTRTAKDLQRFQKTYAQTMNLHHDLRSNESLRKSVEAFSKAADMVRKAQGNRVALHDLKQLQLSVREFRKFQDALAGVRKFLAPPLSSDLRASLENLRALQLAASAAAQMGAADKPARKHPS